MKGYIALLMFLGLNAQASILGDVRLEAKKMTRNESTDSIMLEGKAQISQQKKLLQADKIFVNYNSGLVMAKGNCVYRDGEEKFSAAKMVFRIDDGKWEKKY